MTRAPGPRNDSHTSVMLGDPRKAIYSTVLPFFISAIISQINMLADIAWCSGLGSEYVSAIQTVTPIYWVIFDVGLGIGLGCNVLIARRIGERNFTEAQKTVSQGTVLAVVIAIILAPLLFLLIEPMLTWMDATRLLELSVSYLAPVLVCNVFQVLSPTLSGMLRGEGASSLSNYSLIAGTVANIIMDPILIYGLGLGVMGAGIATAASSVISVIIMIGLYQSGRTYLTMNFRHYRFDFFEFKEIMYVGIPKMIEMFFMDILDAFNRTFLIMCGGIDAVTLFTVPWRLIMLGVMIPNSFALSLTPVSSANIGARKPDKSITAYRLCLRNTAIISAILVVTYFVLADYLVIPFIQSESMAELETELAEVLRIIVLVIPALGFAYVCNAMLQSMRKPMLSLVVTTTRTGLSTLMFALLVGTSVPIMCVGMVAAAAISAMTAFILTSVEIKDLRARYGTGTDTI